MTIANNPGLVSMFNYVLEGFAGAWQRDTALESRHNIIAFSAIYACIGLIANDIAKLRLMLMQRQADGIFDEVTTNNRLLALLDQPNRFQNRIQFLQYWVTSKLMYGNAYIFKERNPDRTVRALYPLNPRITGSLIAPDGEIFYGVGKDVLAGLDGSLALPASEVIHDRMNCMYHPLVGVSPIYACALSATQGLRIQANSELFFKNMSRPSGQLTAPGTISETTAKRLKEEFERNFSGGNLGKIFVGGDGLKYEPMTIPAQDAQLIEQLGWTVQDVARCFGVPLHKIAGVTLTGNPNYAALNQDYYSQTVQPHVEPIELLLKGALGLPDGFEIELDTDNGLLRMDPVTRSDRYEKAIKSAWMAPDEARALEGYHPVTGGATPYLQQQNYSLAALAKRDAQPDPFATAKPPPAPPLPLPAKDGQAELDEFSRVLLVKLTEAVDEL